MIKYPKSLLLYSVVAIAFKENSNTWFQHKSKCAETCDKLKWRVNQIVDNYSLKPNKIHLFDVTHSMVYIVSPTYFVS